MRPSSIASHSPSFNSYSSESIAAIAARVVQELRADSNYVDDDELYEFVEEEEDSNEISSTQISEGKGDASNDNDEDDEEFEFPVTCKSPNSPPKSADEIFYDGQIRPVYPLFNQSLVFGDQNDSNTSNSDQNSFNPVDFITSTSTLHCCRHENKSQTVRAPLRKLFMEDRDTPSCSSSDADDLDGVTPGTYCVWNPKLAGSPSRCEKSSSTGSSRRWRFRNLIHHRSNSDGKDRFLVLSPLKKMEKSSVPNQTVKDGEKRPSMRKYKEEVLGFLSGMNGLSRSLHSF